jgi:hypothetical protein
MVVQELLEKVEHTKDTSLITNKISQFWKFSCQGQKILNHQFLSRASEKLSCECLGLASRLHTVHHQIPNRGRYSDWILCQSRPSENRTIWNPDFFPDFSLDLFKKKRVKKNILFMPKGSRLAKENVRSGFPMVKRWPTIRNLVFTIQNRTQKVSENDHSNTGRSGIQLFTTSSNC